MFAKLIDGRVINLDDLKKRDHENIIKIVEGNIK